MNRRMSLSDVVSTGGSFALGLSYMRKRLSLYPLAHSLTRCSQLVQLVHRNLPTYTTLITACSGSYHSSPLTAHRSNHSPDHRSPLAAHCSELTSHRSQLAMGDHTSDSAHRSELVLLRHQVCGDHLVKRAVRQPRQALHVPHCPPGQPRNILQKHARESRSRQVFAHGGGGGGSWRGADEQPGAQNSEERVVDPRSAPTRSTSDWRIVKSMH